MSDSYSIPDFQEALDIINFDDWRNLWQTNVINNKLAAKADNKLAAKAVNKVVINRVAKVVSKVANRAGSRLPAAAKKVVKRRAAAKVSKAVVSRAARVVVVNNHSSFTNASEASLQ